MLFRFCSSIAAFVIFNAIYLQEPNYGILVAVTYFPLLFSFLISIATTLSLRRFKRQQKKLSVRKIFVLLFFTSQVIATSIASVFGLGVGLLFSSSCVLCLFQFFRLYCDITNEVSKKIFIENVPSLLKIIAGGIYFCFDTVLVYQVILFLSSYVVVLIFWLLTREAEKSFTHPLIVKDNRSEIIDLCLSGLPWIISGPILLGILGLLFPTDSGVVVILSVQLLNFLAATFNATNSLVQRDLWKRELSRADSSFYILLAGGLSVSSFIMLQFFLGCFSIKIITEIVAIAFVKFFVSWIFSNAALFFDSKLIYKPLGIYIIIVLTAVYHENIILTVIGCFSFELIYLTLNMNKMYVILGSCVYGLFLLNPLVLLIVIIGIVAFSKQMRKEAFRKYKTWIGY